MIDTKEAMFERLKNEGGAIVGSGDCSEMEIADANARGDFYVDKDGFGYVRRLKRWLERIHENDGYMQNNPQNSETKANKLNQKGDQDEDHYFEITDDGQVMALPSWQREDFILRARLESVSIIVCEDTVLDWTDEQCKMADCWAIATSFSASDNKGIQVPEKPSFLPDESSFEVMNKHLYNHNRR